MNNLTLDGLLAQAFQLYQKGEYTKAFDLITRETSRFPAWAQTLYFWRICLASRMKQTTLALQLFEEALAAGHWLHLTLLREDEDLEPLQVRTGGAKCELEVHPNLGYDFPSGFQRSLARALEFILPA